MHVHRFALIDRTSQGNVNHGKWSTSIDLVTGPEPIFWYKPIYKSAGRQKELSGEANKVGFNLVWVTFLYARCN